jgi:hypothetical protein
LYAPGDLDRKVALDRNPDEAKYPGPMRVIIIVLGSVFGWTLVLLPIWLLVGV